MSGEDPTTKEITHKAFEMFVVELSRQLDEASRALNSLSGVVNSKSCAELRITFHRIKGGAGFFQEDTLANLASSCEEIFEAEEHRPTREEVVQVRKLLEQMQDISSRLQGKLKSI